MRSCAKVNLFLKILGSRGGYHELASRFWRVESLFDTLEWSEGARGGFEIQGAVSCAREQNTIFKAKEALKPYLSESQRAEMEKLRIVLTKRIPEGAGLGGGSSNAATFLLMARERFNLNLAPEELARVGARVGADVPFFVLGYPSANVRGIGEIVEPLAETPLELELFTPPIHVNTAKVYQSFRDAFLSALDEKKQAQESERLLSASGETILHSPDPLALNDLYKAALRIYPVLENHAINGRFFSGSGSTFFRLAHGA